MTGKGSKSASFCYEDESPEKTMKTSAVFGGVALMALLTMASVHAHKQTLLETQLVDEDVVTKTGTKIPVSQVVWYRQHAGAVSWVTNCR